MTTLFKVISQSEAVPVKKQDGTLVNKSVVVLQEIGGKYENSYVCSLLGNQVELKAGDHVWANLRFSARTYNGSNYMDCTIQEIVSLN